MKKQDKTLFAIPVVIVWIIIGAGLLLVWQLTSFEKQYLEETESELRVRSELLAPTIEALLVPERQEELKNYCRRFSEGATRISLISETGEVLSDSGSFEQYENHAQRPEVKLALLGSSNAVRRHSDTLRTWMLYYATPLHINGKTYVLRLAMDTKNMSATISHAKWNIALAGLLGACVVLFLTLYIILGVRRPLEDLAKSARKIADGDREREVKVPESGIVRDLAEQISAMANQLRTQIKTLQNERNERDIIFNTMSEALVVVDNEGTVVQSNICAVKLLGLPVPRPKKYRLSAHPSEKLSAYVSRLLDNTEPLTEKELTLDIDSTRLILLINPVRLSRGDQSGSLLLSITNLTNIRKLESFRSDFIANVSHEIKTPLTGILSASEMLADNSEASDDIQQKCLQIISLQSKRLNSLLEDVLSLAALERKQFAENKQLAPLELSDTVKNAVELIQSRAKAENINLTITENIPMQIFGDEQLIEQAITNLVNNAVKYSQSSTIEVSSNVCGEYAQISVIDHGVGIPPDHYQRIFERFYRVHKERSRELGGTGLGLAIVKHIAQLHAGSVELQSTLGGGCTFIIRLSRAKVAMR